MSQKKKKMLKKKTKVSRKTCHSQRIYFLGGRSRRTKTSIIVIARESADDHKL